MGCRLRHRRTDAVSAAVCRHRLGGEARVGGAIFSRERYYDLNDETFDLLELPMLNGR
jgi:hypothetical protein